MDGKRNGKGREYYYNNNVKFEGDYKNDKKWNGIGYDLNESISYEIKEGKGIVVEYNYFGMTFKGEYLNGQRNGKGIEYNKSNIIYEGEYFNGKRSGKGKEYDNKGNLIFEGEYLYNSKSKGI